MRLWMCAADGRTREAAQKKSRKGRGGGKASEGTRAARIVQGPLARKRLANRKPSVVDRSARATLLGWRVLLRSSAIGGWTLRTEVVNEQSRSGRSLEASRSRNEECLREEEDAC